MTATWVREAGLRGHVKPCLVILAAGASSRLGTCKALAPITPRCALELLLESGAVLDTAPALVVSGADHAALARALPRGVALARNAQWSAGRTGSVATAARVRSGQDLCLAPVDVPLVPRFVFETLARAWVGAGSPARGWLAPRHAGRTGHPIVVGRALLAELVEELAGFGPDTPLRALRMRAAPLLSVDVECSAILDDFDTPADWRALQARFCT
jgi:molybdenum cofactor cytidylyltransferase